MILYHVDIYIKIYLSIKILYISKYMYLHEENDKTLMKKIKEKLNK